MQGETNRDRQIACIESGRGIEKTQNRAHAI